MGLGGVINSGLPNPQSSIIDPQNHGPGVVDALEPTLMEQTLMEPTLMEPTLMEPTLMELAMHPKRGVQN